MMTTFLMSFLIMVLTGLALMVSRRSVKRGCGSCAADSETCCGCRRRSE